MSISGHIVKITERKAQRAIDALMDLMNCTDHEYGEIEALNRAADVARAMKARAER